jgi:tetratricopeptide (TPR) repeat protein
MTERWPDVPQVLTQAATYQLARGRPGLAESLVMSAVQIDPDSYFARRTLAHCYLKSGREKEAERLYLEEAKRRPDDAETRVDGARFYRELKRYKEAESWAREGIRINPQQEGARGQLAWALLAQGKHEQAAQAFREAIQLRPDSYWNYRGLALTLQAAGNINESLKAAQRSVDLRPDYLEGLMALGRSYHLAGERHRAAEAWERVLAFDSTSTGALNNLAGIYVGEERFSRALTMYRRAAQLDTIGTIYWENIANLALIYLRDFRIAREAATTCARRGRGTKAEAAGLQWLGLIAEMQGYREAAQSRYKKGLILIADVLRRNPNNRDAVAIEGRLYARVGEVGKARRRANWLATTQKEVPDCLYEAAAIMSVAGEKDRALEYLSSAVAAGFDDRALMIRDPDLGSIRKDPRFEKLLASVQ